MYAREVEENFKQFDQQSFATATEVRGQLTGSSARFLASYRFVTSLQAWRTILLEECMAVGARAFFLEAQNDALSSHVLARIGMWRSALQSLRSCIENVLMSLYYMDHPVELRLWTTGEHRLGFSELMTYMQSHPDLAGLAESMTGLSTLRDEYSTLSRAVHASAESFRMTVGGKPELWSSDAVRLGSWATRERKAVTAINLLLLSLFRDKLGGAQRPRLREAVGAVLPASRADAVKKALKITLE